MLYRNWFPSEKGYKEHLDRVYIGLEQIGAIEKQTLELKKSFNQQSNELNSQTQKIIASNEQIIIAIDTSADRLSRITENGFNQISSDIDNLSDITYSGFEKVVSSIENLNSDMNFYFGSTIQQIEFSNQLLNNVLSTLQAPIETVVKEWYNKGCIFIQQENLQLALDYLKKSISAEMGRDFFHSQYQIGRLYLNGVNEDTNLINLELAQEHLTNANKLGNGIAKINESFKPILADCKFFLSQSYFYQLSGNSNSSELDLINNAIKYCEESVLLNSGLSQGFYHLAKYYTYRIQIDSSHHNDDEIEKCLIAFMKAVEIDRNYLRAVIKKDKIMYDKTLDYLNPYFIKLIGDLTEIKRKSASNLIGRAQNYIAQLDELNTSKSLIYAYEFNSLKKIVKHAVMNFETNTYFGLDDCIMELEAL